MDPTNVGHVGFCCSFCRSLPCGDSFTTAVLKEFEVDITLPLCLEVPIWHMPCIWHLPTQIGGLFTNWNTNNTWLEYFSIWEKIKKSSPHINYGKLLPGALMWETNMETKPWQQRCMYVILSFFLISAQLLRLGCQLLSYTVVTVVSA